MAPLCREIALMSGPFAPYSHPLSGGMQKGRAALRYPPLRRSARPVGVAVALSRGLRRDRHLDSPLVVGVV
ncbi:MAG: hypothetical protein VW239_05725, partial [Candidatus Nanopelagicales bacterium]